jgi:hypothetical protein
VIAPFLRDFLQVHFAAKRAHQKLQEAPFFMGFLKTVVFDGELREKAGDYPFEAIWCGMMLNRAKRSRDLSALEQESLAVASLLVGMADFLYDRTKIPRAELQAVFLGSQVSIAEPALDLYKALSERLVEILPEPTLEKFRKSCLYGLDVEDQVRVTQAPSAKLEAIREVTLAKGAISVQIYATLLSRFDINDQNDSGIVLYCGQLIQLLDDIFDIKKDLQDQARTSATAASGLAEIKQYLIEKGEEAEVFFKRLPSSTYDGKFLIRLWRVFVAAGVVHLTNLQRNYGEATALRDIPSTALQFNRTHPRIIFSLIRYLQKAS